VRHSLESVQASVQFIEKAKAKAEQQKAAEKGRLKAHSQPSRAARSGSSAELPDNITVMSAQPKAFSLDVEAFIKSNVASLRIPASAMSHFGTVLNSLAIDQDAIANTLQQLTGRLKE
jgi:hypothetical protein